MKRLNKHGGPTWRAVAPAGGITNNTAVTLAAAPGVGKSLVVTEIDIVNTSATETEVAIRDGAAGTVLWRTAVKGQLGPHTIKSDEGLCVGSPNTLLEVVCLTTGTKTYVNARGVTIG